MNPWGPWRHTWYGRNRGWMKILCWFGGHSFSTVAWDEKIGTSYGICTCGKKKYPKWQDWMEPGK